MYNIYIFMVWPGGITYPLIYYTLRPDHTAKTGISEKKNVLFHKK